MSVKKVLQRTGIVLVSIILLVVLTIYAWSSVVLNKKYDVPLTDMPIPTDSASVAEGARLTRIAHCGDCHNENLTGKVFAEIPPSLATLVAPNLTKMIPSYSNAELIRLLRYGVKKNGHTLYIMPSYMYHELKEESLAKIIAHLRTLKPQPDAPGLPNKSSYALLGRFLITQNKVPAVADLIQPNSKGRYVDCDTTPVSFGRYLAASSCSACHGRELKGEPNLGPDLIIAASYSREDFFKLIRTGVALGNRKLGLMSEVTKDYLSYMNDKEIESIYEYLQTKPTLAQAK